MSAFPTLHWTDHHGQTCSARWRSESGVPAPRRVMRVDDQTPADTAYRLACEGTALLWQGDFHNGRQLLQALARRMDKRAAAGRRTSSREAPTGPAQAFHLHRKRQAERARTLGMLLIPVSAGHQIPLRRAPDVALACQEAYGEAQEDYVIALRELQGLIGAHEWRKKGVPVPALGAAIHPHYGVFSPVRGEYLDLMKQAPLPAALAPNSRAYDIGTGTGVLAAILAQRGVQHVVATDMAPRALACAHDNLARLGLTAQVTLQQTDLFPPGQVPLIVCNPPWVPARPNSSVEQAVYDPDSQMLKGFLAGLASHLSVGGEGWLILSDLAEHLGLRSREDLLQWIDQAGLQVAGRLDIRPRHGKAYDPQDPLHAARAAEVTSLWRLTPKPVAGP
ncbi:methyltransferase [Aquabacterium sp.]|uniref:methyltransferase n=1 Tax=Aquabacterium sp. TaxID=1872578 RepID=UPI0035AFBBFF